MVLPKTAERSVFPGSWGFYSCTVPSFEQLTRRSFSTEAILNPIWADQAFLPPPGDALQEAVRKSPLGDRAEMREADAGLHFLLKRADRGFRSGAGKTCGTEGSCHFLPVGVLHGPPEAEPHCPGDELLYWDGRERMEEAVQRLPGLSWVGRGHGMTENTSCSEACLRSLRAHHAGRGAEFPAPVFFQLWAEACGFALYSL